MVKYVIKRISFALLAIFSVATITFFLMFLVGGGPFLREKALTQETEKALMKNMDWTNPKLFNIKITC
ncbi:hypothetical protein FACS189481_4540 [Clostridia bacterium]|nr:hypothetical protein FACS189481_4540 [Clostridia bacterium]